MASALQGVSMFAGMAGSAYSSYKRMGQGVSIAGFLMEAAIKESSGISFNKTKYPVESGGVISDHISEQQPTLKIDGVVSAMTMGYVSSISSVMSGETNFGSAMSGISGGKQRMTDAKKALEAIAREKASITIVSGIDVYEDYTIDSIQFDRDNSAEKLNISISMSKIYTAQATWAEITRQSSVQKISRKGGATKKSGGAAKASGSSESGGGASNTTTAKGFLNGTISIGDRIRRLVNGR